MEANTFRIDIVSDVVCPWCIIGFKQLERALEKFRDQIKVDLHWHPFELNPNMPEEGQNLGEHLSQKYGTTVEQGMALREKLTELGDSLGFSFNYGDDMRMCNTFKAHQLLHWAKEQGKQTKLTLKLFSSYFSEQQSVDQMEVLIQAAKEVGLDGEEAKAILEKEQYANSVRALESKWLNQGIHAVPAFIFNNKYLVSGAQELNSFVQVIGATLNQEKENV